MIGDIVHIPCLLTFILNNTLYSEDNMEWTTSSTVPLSIPSITTVATITTITSPLPTLEATIPVYSCASQPEGVVTSVSNFSQCSSCSSSTDTTIPQV